MIGERKVSPEQPTLVDGQPAMRALIFPLCLSTFSSSSVLRVTLYPDSLPSLEYVQKRQVPMAMGSVPRPPGMPPFNVPPPPFPPPFLQPRLKNNYRGSPAYKLGYAAANGIHRGKKSIANTVNTIKAQQPTWHWSRQAASFRPTVLVNGPEFVPSPIDTNLNSLNSLLRPQTDLGLRKPKTIVSSSGGNGILVIPFDKTPITNAVHGNSKGLVNHEAKTNQEQPAVIQDEKNVKASIKVAGEKTPPTKTSFGFNLKKQKQGKKKEAPFEIPLPKTPPTRTIFGLNLEKLKKEEAASIEVPPPKTPPTRTTFGFNFEKLKKGKKEETASIRVPPSEDEVHKEVLIVVNPPNQKEEVVVNSGTYDPFEFKGLNGFTKSPFAPESEEFDMNVGLEMVEAAIEGLKRGLGQGSPGLQHHANEGIETEIGIDMVEEAIESIQPQTKRTARGKQQILQRIKKSVVACFPHKYSHSAKMLLTD